MGAKGSTVIYQECLEWKLKQKMKRCGQIQFVSNDCLTICKDKSVEVHQVTRESTQLLYKLKCNEWRGDMYPIHVAVSESIPDSILVVSWGSGFVHQFPCQESVEYVKKYQIHNGEMWPRCIAANANTAVIGLWRKQAMVVCSLPGFTNQRKVKLSLIPWDICITTGYLVVMGVKEVVIKALGSIDHDVCRMKAPDGWGSDAVSCRNDARQLYVACHHVNDRKSAVYKYTRDRNGTSQYVNTGCVIDNLDGEVWMRGLSISADGMLAVSTYKDTRVFSLE